MTVADVKVELKSCGGTAFSCAPRGTSYVAAGPSAVTPEEQAVWWQGLQLCPQRNRLCGGWPRQPRKRNGRGSAYARSCLVRPEPSPQPSAEVLRVVGLSPHSVVACLAGTSPPRPKAGQEWD
eukprot:366512-Chlamydomonas_euryale.AAC.15